MKKPLFLILLLSIFLLPLYSQIIVEDVNINELEIKYCEIVGYNKSILGQKIVITVDYGQNYNLFQPQKIKKTDGEVIVFNSMIEALNFMEDNGWQYVNNYAITMSNQNVYHYLLKRK